MILAGAALLTFFHEEDASRVSRAIYEATFEAILDGIKTADLGGSAGTSEFTDEIIRHIRTKLEVWSAEEGTGGCSRERRQEHLPSAPYPAFASRPDRPSSAAPRAAATWTLGDTPSSLPGLASPLEGARVDELGEIIGDKLPATPSRTALPPLLGRAASGGLVGAAAFVSAGPPCRDGRPARLRRRRRRGVRGGKAPRARSLVRPGLPDSVVALAEDGVVLLVGSRASKNVRIERGRGREEGKAEGYVRRAALLYDELRPGYPEDLFDDVVSLSGIPAGGRIRL